MARKRAPRYPPKLWEHNELYKNQQGRRDSHFIRLYDSQLYSPAMKHLSGEGLKLYILLRDQYRERPEQTGGEVKCPYKYLLENGFKSRDTISRKFVELEKFGLINIKVSGGFGIPSVYRFSDKWKTISEEEALRIKKELSRKARTAQDRT